MYNPRMNTQAEDEIGPPTELKHESITKTVIGCAFEVINELGAGFLESVYEKALLLALRPKGLSAVAQHPARVMFRGECVVDFTRISSSRKG